MKIEKGILGLALAATGTALSLFEEYELRGIVISVKAQFGYSTYLPLSFWFGFLLLLFGICLIMSAGRRAFYLPALAMISVVMLCVPVFASQLPTHNDAFWHMGTTQWLIQAQKYDPSSIRTYTRLTYLQYPAFFEFFGILLNVTHLDPMLVLKLYPPFATLLMAFGFYILARRLLHSENLAFIAAVTGLSVNVATGTNHFSPSATAQALFPLILFLTVWALESRRREPTVLVLVAFLTLTILHPVLSFFYIGLLVGLAIMSHPVLRLGNAPERNRVFLTRAILIMAILFIGWNIYVATEAFTAILQAFSIFQSILFSYQESILTSQILQRQTIISPLAGWIRRIVFLGAVLPACILSFRNMLRRKLNSIGMMFLVTVFFWFVASLVSVLSDRILTWVVPFAVLIFILEWKGSSVKRFPRFFTLRPLLASILIATICLTFVSSYSGEAVNYTSQAEATGIRYLVKNVYKNDTLYESGLFYGGDLNYELNFFNDSTRNFNSSQHIDQANIVYFSQILFNTEYFTTGNEQNAYTHQFIGTINDPSFNLVYSNPEFTMFKRS